MLCTFSNIMQRFSITNQTLTFFFQFSLHSCESFVSKWFTEQMHMQLNFSNTQILPLHILWTSLLLQFSWWSRKSSHCSWSILWVLIAWLESHWAQSIADQLDFWLQVSEHKVSWFQAQEGTKGTLAGWQRAAPMSRGAELDANIQRIVHWTLFHGTQYSML